VAYTPAEAKKELAKVYVHTGVELVKLYGPSALVIGSSIASMITSHNIMRGRNVALAAAYTAVDTSFKEYRNRIKERFGEELDKEIRYNLKEKEVEETVVDENGNEVVVKKTVKAMDDEYIPSEYAFFFDETCSGWTKNSEANKAFLLNVQNWCNEKLQSRGHLFLNEVLDELGAQRTRAGNEVGWWYDKNGVDCGDNYVDFGIFEQNGSRYDEAKRRFVNGHERSILIDPNVDGPILSRFPG
jgi:hypothetical protein